MNIVIDKHNSFDKNSSILSAARAEIPKGSFGRSKVEAGPGGDRAKSKNSTIENQGGLISGQSCSGCEGQLSPMEQGKKQGGGA